MASKHLTAPRRVPQVWLLGGCAAALGLGALFASSLRPAAALLIAGGAAAHGWAMYRISQGNAWS